VSLTMRKNQVSAGLDQARQAAAQVSPVAKNAMAQVTPVARDAMAQATPAAKDAAARVTPLAKAAGAAVAQAGVATAQGVQGAGQWARPRIALGVHHARRWAAPRIEQAGQSLSQTVAPKVSDMMTATARRVEPTGDARGRRLWPRLAAGLAMVCALGGVIAVVLRRRSATLPDDVLPDEMVHPPREPDESETDGEEVVVEAEVGANGNSPRA
jgi:hypothetical protein